MNKNLYETIGSNLNVYSTTDQIEKTYLKKIYEVSQKVEKQRKKNPETIVQTLNHLTEIDEAFQTLINPVSREEYNSSLRATAENDLQHQIFNREKVLELFAFMFDQHRTLKEMSSSTGAPKATSTKDEMLTSYRSLKREVNKLQKELTLLFKSMNIEELIENKNTEFVEKLHSKDPAHTLPIDIHFTEVEEAQKQNPTYRELIYKTQKPGYIFNRTKVFRRSLVQTEIIPLTENEIRIAIQKGSISQEEYLNAVNDYQNQAVQNSQNTQTIQPVGQKFVPIQPSVVYQQPVQQPIQQPVQQVVYQQPIQQPVQQVVYQQPVQQPIEQPVQHPVEEASPLQPMHESLTSEDEFNVTPDLADQDKFNNDFAARWERKTSDSHEEAPIELSQDEKKDEVVLRLRTIKKQLQALENKKKKSPDDLKNILELVRQLKGSIN